MKLLVVIAAAVLVSVDGFSNRKFTNSPDLNFACQNLYPKHAPFEPQTANNPYSLTVADVPGGKRGALSRLCVCCVSMSVVV